MPPVDRWGTDTQTFSQEVEPDGDLYCVIRRDSAGNRKVIARNLTLEEAKRVVTGRHPTLNGSIRGAVPDTRFDRMVLNDTESQEK